MKTWAQILSWPKVVHDRNLGGHEQQMGQWGAMKTYIGYFGVDNEEQ